MRVKVDAGEGNKGGTIERNKNKEFSILGNAASALKKNLEKVLIRFQNDLSTYSENLIHLRI